MNPDDCHHQHIRSEAVEMVPIPDSLCLWRPGYVRRGSRGKKVRARSRVFLASLPFCSGHDLGGVARTGAEAAEGPAWPLSRAPRGGRRCSRRRDGKPGPDGLRLLCLEAASAAPASLVISGAALLWALVSAIIWRLRKRNFPHRLRAERSWLFTSSAQRERGRANNG